HALVVVEAHSQIALGNRHPGRAISVHAHRPEMDDVSVETGLDYGGEKIVGGVDVVVDRVALMPRALHRVRGGALLGEVHDRLRLPVQKQVQHLPVVDGNVEAVEGDLTPGQLTPCG